MGSTQLRPRLWLIARFALYGVGAMLGSQYLFRQILHHGPAIAVENGPLELLQVAIAALGGAALAAAATLARDGRTGLAVCAGMLTYAAARECDLWIEQITFDDAYKYLAGGPIAVAVVWVAWRERGRLTASLRWASHPSAGLFLAGAVQIAAVAALFDHADLWEPLGSYSQTRSMKALVEEVIELTGYLALTVGALELFFTSRRERAAPGGEVAV